MGCITSQLVPSYNKCSFLIRNYTEKRKKKEVIYTETFQTRGLEWRLKIYPNGNENSEDIYISIFVELFGVVCSDMQALQEVGKYKYKVEVLSQRNTDLRISREFDSEFELGECWGYNTYAKISALYEDGFVHPEEDYLEIVLHIKSPSFYHHVLDQNRLLAEKKRTFERNNQRLRELKKALSMTSPLASNILLLEEREHVNKLIRHEQILIDLSKLPLLDLDEICEVRVEGNLDESPRIHDEEIYSPVICSNQTRTNTKPVPQLFEEQHSAKSPQIRRV